MEPTCPTPHVTLMLTRAGPHLTLVLTRPRPHVTLVLTSPGPDVILAWQGVPIVSHFELTTDDTYGTVADTADDLRQPPTLPDEPSDR